MVFFNRSSNLVVKTNIDFLLRYVSIKCQIIYIYEKVKLILILLGPTKINIQIKIVEEILLVEKTEVRFRHRKKIVINHLKFFTIQTS